MNLTPKPPRARPSTTQEVFEAWARIQRDAGRIKKTASEQVYSGMWRAWSEWLHSRSTPWHAIGPAELNDFLNGPAPGQHNRRTPRNQHQMSNYTRQRYWHLLESVYQCATAEGWIERNPAAAVDPIERPRIQERSRQAQTLPPGVLDLLRSADVLRQLIEQEHDGHWWRLRDRAAMALLAHTGLSSSELIALQGRDLRSRAPLTGAIQLCLPGTETDQATLWLDVRDGAHQVSRTLALPETLAQILRPWLARRQRLLAEHQARAGHLAGRDAYLKEHDRQGAVFPSREAAATSDPLPAMRPHTLHLMITRTLHALYAHQMGRHLDKRSDGVQVAHGSAIIRNSVIRQWLDTLGVPQTLALAGLKNESSLRLLARPGDLAPPQGRHHAVGQTQTEDTRKAA